LVGAGACSSKSSLATPQQVFVLAGQSNMLGRAVPVSQGAKSDPRLLVWRKAGGWQVAVDPLGDPKDKTNGVGPGMTFGISAIHKLNPQAVGLVQCAISGTTISKWQPPHSAYSNCISQVRAAGGHIDGILFLQGESDATNNADAGSWAKRFKVVLTAFRTDLGADVPMVMAQIGKINSSDFPYQQTVRDQQTKAAGQSAGLTMITTLDLKTQSDGVHFTVDSQKTLGTRFAAAWWQLRHVFLPLRSGRHV
jgi:hypothetical protein